MSDARRQPWKCYRCDATGFLDADHPTLDDRHRGPVPQCVGPVVVDRSGPPIELRRFVWFCTKCGADGSAEVPERAGAIKIAETAHAIGSTCIENPYVVEVVTSDDGKTIIIDQTGDRPLIALPPPGRSADAPPPGRGSLTVGGQTFAVESWSAGHAAPIADIIAIRDMVKPHSVPIEDAFDLAASVLASSSTSFPRTSAPNDPRHKPAVGPAHHARRNAPCPCGSGRKFKRCHGLHRRPPDPPPRIDG